MRTNLKVYRIRRQLTQTEISKRIGCGRATYAAIENGKRDGRKTFWNALQQALNVPTSDMWELMRRDEEA